MDRFFHPELHKESQQVLLSAEESQHLVKVLRKRTGDRVELINGHGGIAQAEVITADAKGSVLHINTFEYFAPLPYSLHIAMAPTKSNDRFEWFLEKATEIGVSQITPILCHQSERRKINLTRYEKILLSAVKQSKQYYLPKLHPLTTFQDFISQHATAAIAHCHPGKKEPLSTLPLDQLPDIILIGPEGDFSTTEVENAITQGLQPITLGSQRFRTETAGIVACHSIAFRMAMTTT